MFSRQSRDKQREPASTSVPSTASSDPTNNCWKPCLGILWLFWFPDWNTRWPPFALRPSGSTRARSGSRGTQIRQEIQPCDMAILTLACSGTASLRYWWRAGLSPFSCFLARRSFGITFFPTGYFEWENERCTRLHVEGKSFVRTDIYEMEFKFRWFSIIHEFTTEKEFLWAKLLVEIFDKVWKNKVHWQ